MNWVLIIILGGFASLGGVKSARMTEAQCKASVRMLAPMKSNLGAACIGPNGEAYTFDDVAADK